MTTKIRSVFTNSTAVLTIRPSLMRPPSILVCADELDASAAVAVSRDDFLAAVETECGVRIVPGGAIVIDRDELPVVIVSDIPGAHEIRGYTYSIAEAAVARRYALNLLALAEYLAAHPPTPPVAEADVEALGDLIRQYWDRNDADETARSLIATGRVSVTHE